MNPFILVYIEIVVGMAAILFIDWHISTKREDEE